MSIHEVFRMSLYRLCEMRIDLEPSRKYSFLGKNEKLDILLTPISTKFCGGKFLFYFIFLSFLYCTCGQKSNMEPFYVPTKRHIDLV